MRTGREQNPGRRGAGWGGGDGAKGETHTRLGARRWVDTPVRSPPPPRERLPVSKRGAARAFPTGPVGNVPFIPPPGHSAQRDSHGEAHSLVTATGGETTAVPRGLSPGPAIGLVPPARAQLSDADGSHVHSAKSEALASNQEAVCRGRPELHASGMGFCSLLPFSPKTTSSIHRRRTLRPGTRDGGAVLDVLPQRERVESFLGTLNQGPSTP